MTTCTLGRPPKRKRELSTYLKARGIGVQAGRAAKAAVQPTVTGECPEGVPGMDFHLVMGTPVQPPLYHTMHCSYTQVLVLVVSCNYACCSFFFHMAGAFS